MPPYIQIKVRQRTPDERGGEKRAHLAMHGKVDRRVDLLDALAARHARPMSGWQRTRGHKLGREAERLEPLHEANNKVARLVHREFPSQTLCEK